MGKCQQQQEQEQHQHQQQQQQQQQQQEEEQEQEQYQHQQQQQQQQQEEEEEQEQEQYQHQQQQQQQQQQEEQEEGWRSANPSSLRVGLQGSLHWALDLAARVFEKDGMQTLSKRKSTIYGFTQSYQYPVVSTKILLWD